jgi:hypothetical protein
LTNVDSTLGGRCGRLLFWRDVAAAMAITALAWSLFFDVQNTLVLATSDSR